MSWKDRGDLGSKVVAETYDLLEPPVVWTDDIRNGFRWWPSGLCQRIWCDEGVFRNCRTFYRLHAEIDLIKGFSHREAIATALEEAMDDCVLSCLVYDKSADVFRLHASVYAEDELWHWVCPLFVAAAQSQLANSQRIIDSVKETTHPVLAVSPHPNGSVRDDHDSRMSDSASPFLQAGRARSIWGQLDEWRKVDWALERQADSFQPTNKRSSLSKFYWNPDPKRSIELYVSSEEPHPTLGNGLHFTLTVPLDMSSRHIAHMALDLNDHERADWLNTHLLGSWCNHNHALAFRLFVPNALYREGVLEGLTVTMATRAIWVNEYFTNLKAEAERCKQSHA